MIDSLNLSEFHGMKTLQEQQSSKARISAVIVTYQPCMIGLKKLLSVVTYQVDAIFVIDNGSRNGCLIDSLVKTVSNAKFISLSENKGIAYAQNIGITASHERDIEYVLTLDQDSVPTPNMVRTLRSTFHTESSNGRIGAIGPMLIDEATRLSLPFFSYAQGYKQRITPEVGLANHEVEFLVSSGTLLSMQAIKEIGLMREELFISYVDVEWCLRAKNKGFRILGTCRTSMDHNLGEKRIRLGPFIVPLHSPLRHFYLFRSGIYMQRLPYITDLWKSADRKQLLRSFIIFSIAGLPNPYDFMAMVRGVLTGLRMDIRAIPILPALNTIQHETVQLSKETKG
jgi:rhamnosyltransferase